MTHDSSLLDRLPRIPTGSAGVPFASGTRSVARPAARRGMLLALGVRLVCFACLMALALFTSGNIAAAAETEAGGTSASSAKEAGLDSTMTLGDMAFSYSSSWTVKDADGKTYFYPATNVMMMVCDPVTLPQTYQDPQTVLDGILEGMMNSFDASASCESASLGEPSFSSSGTVTTVTASIQIRMFSLDFLGIVCAAVSGDTAYCLTAAASTDRAAQYLPVFQTVWDTATIPGMSADGTGAAGGSSEPKAETSGAKVDLDSTMTLGDMTLSYSSSWIVREGSGATYLYPDGTMNAMMTVIDPVALPATDQDPQSQLEGLLEGLASGFGADSSSEDSSVGEPTFSTSGTVTTAKASIRFTLDGQDYAGFICAAVNSDTVYAFEAIASVDQITRYEPAFQAVWDTVVIPGMDVGEAGDASQPSKSTGLSKLAVH